MARSGAAPQTGAGRVKALRFGWKPWARRDGLWHHPGVQIDLDTLPDDPAVLQQMLRDVVHQHGALHAENDKLRLLIQRLLRQQFGRRSEQLSPDQLQLGLEDLEQSVAENQAGQEAVEAQQGCRRPAPPRRRPGATTVPCRSICHATRC
jgi:hypothetical protein